MLLALDKLPTVAGGEAYFILDEEYYDVYERWREV